MDIMRSLMFTPGQRQSMIDKAMGLDMDALIFDFEDAVPLPQKDTARALVAEALQRQRRAGGPARLVRVNATASGRQTDDLAAIVGAGLDAVVLPKVDDPAEVVAADALIAGLEARAGVPTGHTRIIAAIESARGLHRVEDIALANARMVGLMFGAEDFALDVGLPVTRTGASHELVYARSRIVVAATIARLHSMDQVFMDLKDLDGLRADAIESRQLGFTGKGAIHPAQIAILNEVFSPSAEDLAQARDIVEAFHDAEAAGIGCTLLRGQVVELPIVARALRTLGLQAQLDQRGSASASVAS